MRGTAKQGSSGFHQALSMSWGWWSSRTQCPSPALMMLLTGGHPPLQRLQLQALRGLGQLADLPALLVHIVDSDSLASDQQGHQDGHRRQRGSAAEGGPAGQERERLWGQTPKQGALWSPSPTVPLNPDCSEQRTQRNTNLF